MATLNTILPLALDSQTGNAWIVTTVGNIDNGVGTPDAAFITAAGDSISSIFYTIQNINAGFGSMLTLNYNIRYKIESLNGDTETLFVRVWDSTGSTPYTDEETVATTTSNISVTNKGSTGMTMTAAGLAATQIDWQGALIEIRTDHSSDMGKDGSQWGIDEVELTGTYDLAPAPDAPTNVAATDGTYGDKVTITWTKPTGASGYRVYEGSNLLQELGDVATYDDTAAATPTIVPGTASATDATDPDDVTLSVAGESITAGTSRTYKVVAFNGQGASPDSSTDDGYRQGSPAYQWERSSGDADSGYSTLGGATTDPYTDTTGVIFPDGRYYRCAVSTTGVSSSYTTTDRGYRSPPQIPPEVILNSPVNDSEVATSTPTVEFTGLDGNNEDIEYQVQIDTDAAFKTQTGHTIDSYSGGDDVDISFDSILQVIGQSFTGDGSKVTSVTLRMKKTGNPNFWISTRMYEHTGTFGSDGQPGTFIVNGIERIHSNDITWQYEDYVLPFNSDVLMEDGVNYFVAVRIIDANSSNYISISADNTSPSHGGNTATYNGSSWSVDSTRDINFILTSENVPLLDKFSETPDATFTNTTDGGDTHPFDSGDKCDYTIQGGDALSYGRYYWRVRGKDPLGTDTWGAWSDIGTFEYSKSTVALNSPADTAEIFDTTPTFEFTGTDASADDLEYDIQIGMEDMSSLELCDSYPISNQDSKDGLGLLGQVYHAQSFTGNGGILDSIRVAARTSALHPITAKIYAHTGTYGSGGKPTGAALATSEESVYDYIIHGPSAIPPEIIELKFNNGLKLEDGTNYCLVIDYSDYPGGSQFFVGIDSTSSTHSGNYSTSMTGTTWSYLSGQDMIFYVYTLPPSELIKRSETPDATFTNTTDGGDTHPFDSGDKADYTVQGADELSLGTYYWRVRAKDPLGSDTYGAWSSTRSFDLVTGGEGAVVQLNIGNNWKDYASAKLNIGNSWKDVIMTKQNIGGVWKDVF